MTQAAFRGPTTVNRVVFDGQSLNNIPPGNDGMPWLVMTGRSVPWANVAINGTAWEVLANTAATRLFTQAGHATRTILVMTGGTQDVLNGWTAAQIYNYAKLYADAARAAGFDKIIYSTITPCNLLGHFTVSEDTERHGANTLAKANADNAFDLVVDLDVAPLNDPLGGCYVDGLHWNNTGAIAAANLISPALSSLLL